MILIRSDELSHTKLTNPSPHPLKCVKWFFYYIIKQIGVHPLSTGVMLTLFPAFPVSLIFYCGGSISFIFNKDTNNK